MRIVMQASTISINPPPHTASIEAMNAQLPEMAGASDFRAAMRQLASGVTIVTSGSGPRRRGITATAVCSLSATPPALIVCMNKNSDCHQTVLSCGWFGVNVLAAEHEPLAQRFAGRGQVRGAARFLEGEWTELSSGAPVLRGAVATFDCVLHESLDGGTHSILVGQVIAARADSDRPALLYRSGAFLAFDPPPAV